MSLTEGARYPDLAGLPVLITGAGSGIGASIALHFAAQGAKIAAFDLNAERLAQTCAEIKAETGTTMMPRTVDLRDIAALKQAVSSIAAELGAFRVLINNAGDDARLPWDQVTPEYWDDRFQVNLRHQFFAAQAVAPGMAAAGGGAIVHNASIDASGGDGPFAAYNASKAALLGLNRTMALELAEHGIRSNCVSPGFTHTEMTEKAVGPEMMSYLNGQFARVPMKRLVRTDEVANAILFLASDDASAITGIDLRVDCGLTSNWFILETLPEH